MEMSHYLNLTHVYSIVYNLTLTLIIMNGINCDRIMSLELFTPK